MKKVRYMIGALGVAPAVAFMMPTANTATDAAAHTGKVGKSVSLIHGRMVRPALDCGNSKSAKTTSVNGHFRGSEDYQGSGCIFSVFGNLDHHQSGLTLRVRTYSLHGTRDHQYFDSRGQELGDGHTSWGTGYIGVHDHQVCQALVTNGTSNVRYGPICETL